MQSINLKAFNDWQVANLLTKFLPPVASVALVILIANNLADLTWYVAPGKSSAPIPVTQTSIQTPVVNNSASTLNLGREISNWHLFGEVVKELPKPVVEVPQIIEPEDAPDTSLRLTLKGVVASRDMMSAWAIIADGSNNEETYGIDDTLPGNATLKEIYADRIILLHNGRLETLRLPENDITGISNAQPRSARRSTNRSSSTRSSPRRSSRVSSGPVTHLSNEAARVVKSYKDKLMSDPQSVMNTLRAEPYRQAGRLKGYRIFPGKDKQLFGQVGLEPGDVVTAVNGIELDSPLKGLEVMQNITNASEVSVNVLRNGSTQTFMVPLN